MKDVGLDSERSAGKVKDVKDEVKKTITDDNFNDIARTLEQLSKSITARENNATIKELDEDHQGRVDAEKEMKRRFQAIYKNKLQEKMDAKAEKKAAADAAHQAQVEIANEDTKPGETEWEVAK